MGSEVVASCGAYLKVDEPWCGQLGIDRPPNLLLPPPFRLLALINGLSVDTLMLSNLLTYIYQSSSPLL